MIKEGDIFIYYNHTNIIISKAREIKNGFIYTDKNCYCLVYGVHPIGIEQNNFAVNTDVCINIKDIKVYKEIENKDFVFTFTLKKYIDEGSVEMESFDYFRDVCWIIDKKND